MVGSTTRGQELNSLNSMLDIGNDTMRSEENCAVQHMTAHHQGNGTRGEEANQRLRCSDVPIMPC